MDDKVNITIPLDDLKEISERLHSSMNPKVSFVKGDLEAMTTQAVEVSRLDVYAAYQIAESLMCNL